MRREEQETAGISSFLKEFYGSEKQNNGLLKGKVESIGGCFSILN